MAIVLDLYYHGSESNTVLISITKITHIVTVNAGSNGIAKANKETVISGMATEGNDGLSGRDATIFVDGVVLNTTKTNGNGSYAYAANKSLWQNCSN